jgi:hypothetical protein
MRVNDDPFNDRAGDALSRNKSNFPTAGAVTRSSTGVQGAPLVPFDERSPTSLELLRKLEDFVRELFEISSRA